MKYKNIEFRLSDFNGYEIVRWLDNNTCCTIALFKKHPEGYDMVTVGDRFFMYPDAFIVAKHAIAFLNEVYEIEKDQLSEF